MNKVVGIGFATSFAILITLGQIFAYSRGMRPAIDYAASRHPRLNAVSFGDLSSVRLVTLLQLLSVAPSSITWITPGLLRFAWAW